MRKQTIKPAVFDGSNRLETESPVTVGEPPSISFACWVRLDSYGGNQVFFGNRVQMSLSTYNGKLQVVTNHANGTYMGIAGTSLAVDGESYHIVGTYDKDALDGRLKLYINGKLVSTKDQRDGNLAETLYGVAVGALTGGLNQSIGEVYDGLVYTQALTADQVKRLYNNKLGISATSLKYLGLDQGLICAYVLDEENEGIDLSGNGYHLSNINNVTFDGSAVDVLHTGIQTRTAMEFPTSSGKLESETLTSTQEQSEVTLCGWYYYNEAAFNRQDIFRSDSISFRIFDGDFNFAWVQNNGSYRAQGLSLEMIQDTVYFFCLVYRAGIGTFIYINGVLEHFRNVEAYNGLPLQAPTKINVGAVNYWSESPIWDCMIINRALLDEEVTWLYNKGFGRDPYLLPSNIKQGLLCNYPLDLKSYGKDISGNGYDLTAVNNPTATGLTTQQKISNYQTGQ